MTSATSHAGPRNKIERRLFNHITQSCRGRSLVSHEVVVTLIANTATGLNVQAALDTNTYPTGIRVSKAEMAAGKLVRPPQQTSG